MWVDAPCCLCVSEIGLLFVDVINAQMFAVLQKVTQFSLVGEAEGNK